MVGKGRLLLIFSFVFLATSMCFADSKKGTESEAKLLLERAVNLMRIDEVVALTMMTIPNGGFHQKDLYPFCTSFSGIQVAHPYGGAGLDMREFTSSDGKKLYDIMVKNTREGVISKISYKFGKPEDGSLTIKEYTKVAFYTRVGNYHLW